MPQEIRKSLGRGNETLETLENLLGKREVDGYLKQFQRLPRERFATVKVGGEIIESQLDELTWALSELYRIGLYPVVIHGGGPQINAFLKHEGIHTESKNGLRVTSKEALFVSRQATEHANRSIVDALVKRGVAAEPLTRGVFKASLIDKEEYGYVGKVEDVRIEEVRKALEAGKLPIISCFGEDATGEDLNINGDTAAAALAKALEPRRYMALTTTGGVLDEELNLISEINVTDQTFQELLSAEWLNGGMELKVKEAARLLKQLPVRSTVSITDPKSLIKELFTDVGAGTLLRHDRTMTLQRRQRRKLT